MKPQTIGKKEIIHMILLEEQKVNFMFSKQ